MSWLDSIRSKMAQSGRNMRMNGIEAAEEALGPDAQDRLTRGDGRGGRHAASCNAWAAATSVDAFPGSDADFQAQYGVSKAEARAIGRTIYGE